MAGSTDSLLPPPQVSSIQLSIHTSSCSLLFPGQKREQILPYPEYLWCLSSTPTFPRHHYWHLIATECQLPWTLDSLQGSVWMQPCYSLWVYVVWGMEIFVVDYWNSATRMVRTSEHRQYGNEQSLAVFAVFIPRSGSAYPSRQAEMMSVCRLLPLQVDCWSAATYPGIHVDEKYQRMPFFHICICTFIHRHSEISLYLKKKCTQGCKGLVYNASGHLQRVYKDLAFLLLLLLSKQKLWVFFFFWGAGRKGKGRQRNSAIKIACIKSFLEKFTM